MPLTADQKRHAQQFRELFMLAMKPFINSPVCLSGGVDSATQIAALLAMGQRPRKAYTFIVGSYVSPDAQVAKSMCLRFGIRHETISIPQNEEQLIADVKHVLSITDNPSKTHVQCSQPFIYLSTAAKRDGFDSLIVGLGAGPLWGNGRKAETILHASGEAACRAFRSQHVHSPTSSSHSIDKVAASYGVKLYEPWHNPEVERFMLARDWSDLHTPMQKGLAVRAFPDFWKAGAWYRKNSNFQINSKLRDWHDTLISSHVNTKGYKSVTGIYNEINRGLHVK